MPKQVVKSGLAAKLGAKGRQAFEAHKADETVFSSGGDLPAGIEAGVAKLVDCKFDVYKDGDNKGEYYFYAAGVVVSPEELKTEQGMLRIAGLRTSIMEPLCDTPKSNGKRKTLDQHFQWVLNEMRKLGADTSEVDFDNLDATAAALKESGTHFRFRTWKGQKATSGPYKDREPRTQHDWRGSCEYSEDGSGDAGMVDETAEAGATVEEVTTTEQADPQEGEVDLAASAVAADGGDQEAAIAVAEAAEQADIVTDEYPDWVSVVEAINGAGSEEEAAADEPRIPAKGDVYEYTPPGKRKAAQVEITAVFEGKQTVNCKDLATNAPYKSVPWDKLKQPD